MSAIITDQLRILNAKNFVSSIGSTTNPYYVFVGLPNATEYDSDWDSTPPAPKDNFDNEDQYWETMVALKKVVSGDVKRVIRKIQWESGFTYDMYRHDINRDNVSVPSESTSLYYSNYYVVNKDYKVYICINNGVDDDNVNGRPSFDEPTFVDLEPRAAGESGDGYLWKYLYTISPSDIVKFDTVEYIPVPDDWGNDTDSQLIKNNASVSGQIKTTVINTRGIAVGPANEIYENVPIKGDGSGALATIVLNADSEVESVTVTNGGSGYSYASIDYKSVGIGDNLSYTSPNIDVIIPPRGGHGYDIYRELGAFNVLVYSRIENDSENPDFIVGNQIARFGIVQSPQKYGSTDVLDDDKVSALYALKLKGSVSDGDYLPDSVITQTVSTGSTAVGRVISYDTTTGVLKYWRDRTNVGFNSDGTKNYSPTYGFEYVDFTASPGTGGDLVINSSNGISLELDETFGSAGTPASSVVINNRTYNLGQEFQEGLSNPEVEGNTGNVIYVDNRPSITRSKSQREDIKVILRF